MKHRSIAAFALALFVAPTAGAAPDSQEGSNKDALSYAIGYQMGQTLKSNDFDLNPATVAQAVEDALSGAQPELSRSQRQAAIARYRDQQMQARQNTARENLEKGKAFLASNREKQGVEELPSGLQYKVISEGDGKKPQADDQVVVHYRGTLLDGTEFDSSYSRGEPTTLPVSGVIEGWQQALQKMHEGAHWKIFIPPQLAYGKKGAGRAIGPNETLIFDLKLLSIK